MGKKKKTTKIEKWNLSRRIEEMMADGYTVGEITEALNSENEGLDIGKTTVGRYVKEIREKAGTDAFKLMREHVNRNIKDDMKALEEIERLCLLWATEEKLTTAERMSRAMSRVREEVDSWRELVFLASDDEERSEEAIRKIMQKSMEYWAEDARLQKKRLSAMRVALDVINMKLKNAGVLDDEGRGRIVIVGHEEYEKEQKYKGKPGEDYKPLLIQGGKEDP